MTLITVVNAARVTLATDELVVPAEQVRSLTDAIETARALSLLHEQENARVQAAEHAARERGQREGYATGAETAADQLAGKLVTLRERAEREREAMRRMAADNALGIVRHIATTLGETDTLAALAIEAARDLMPVAGLTVQVRPDRVEAVRERLSETASRSVPSDGGVEHVGRHDVTNAFVAALTVEADDSLEPGQCRLRSEDGLVVLAGLDTQLGKLERLARRRTVAEEA